MTKKLNMNLYKNIIKANVNVPFRTETIGDVNYTVVPMIMMVVGVHSGANSSPMLYSEQELSHFHQAWNGEPICVQHTQAEGIYVSANDPHFYENQIIGKVFHTTFEDGKLKAEAYLETNKSAEILSYISAGNQLEVSTGLFSDDIPSPGEFNGERYEAIATNITPDHLALLPGGTGACSWQDGCGIRANEENDVKRKKKEVENVEKKDNTDLFFNYLEDPDFIVNEMDYVRLMETMRTKIDTLDVQGEKYCYLRAMMPDHVIYRAEYSNRETSDKLYKRNYNIVDGDIEWTSDPIEVQENTTYDPVPNVNTNKGEKTVTKKKEGVCCLEEVKTFVANEDNTYTENDVDWMSKLDAVGFKSIVANSTPKEKEVIVEKEVEVAQTLDQVLANTDPALGESLKHGMQVLKDRKAALITGIKANKDNTYTDADLEGFSIDLLEKTAKLAAVPVVHNYVGNGGAAAPVVNATNEEEPLEDVYNRKEENKEVE